MEKTLIRVTLKSFEQPAIDAAILKLGKLSAVQHLIDGDTHHRSTEWVPLPPTITRFTVLRSPHIDKKSREQFQQRTIGATLCFPLTTAGAASLLLTLLRESQLIGVQLRVTVSSTSGLCQ